MKKVILNSFVVMLATILITSCSAIHNVGVQASTSTVLSQANFSYVKKDLIGKATCTYIIGIGGMAKDALAQQAKESLLKSNPLKDNQALANMTVNFKASNILGIFSQVTCTIGADIVEFRK